MWRKMLCIPFCTYYLEEKGKNFWANIMGWKCGVIGNTLSEHGENTKNGKILCPHTPSPKDEEERWALINACSVFLLVACKFYSWNWNRISFFIFNFSSWWNFFFSFEAHNSRPADLTGQAIGRAPKSSSSAEGGKEFHLHSTGFEPRMKFGDISPEQVYQKNRKAFLLTSGPRLLIHLR